METKIVPRYCDKRPSAQTALDIFKGSWKSSLPEHMHLITGPERQFFADPRVIWVNSLLPGGLSGLDILELGPFEGYDSYLFTTLGAKKVTSIEANNINFLKCILLKDTLNFDVYFLHGDFIEYLRATSERYDIIWASGVLYHSTQPIELLQQIARHTDRVFIWTHYFDERLLTNEHRGYFYPRRNIEQIMSGQKYNLHYRSYHLESYGDGLPLHYEGGLQPFSYWLSRADIECILLSLHFTNIRIEGEGDLAGMPYIGLLAERA